MDLEVVEDRGDYMGYNELNEAIWKRAVDDDIASVNELVYNRAWNAAYTIYTLHTKHTEPLLMDDDKFKKFKEDIEAFIDLKNKDLVHRIKELVYEEYEEWPLNKRNKKDKDQIYNDLYKELLMLTIDFAKVRMLNTYRRL